jgi:hypothetical protein
MESILLPPYLAERRRSCCRRKRKHRELVAILLALCRRLLKVPTRLVFTSREALPAPFDGEERSGASCTGSTAKTR